MVVTETFSLSRQAIIYYRASRTRDFGPLVEYLQQDIGKTVCGSLLAFTATFMNIIADIMMVHRCYIIWGSNRILGYTLGLVALSLNSISIATAILGSVGLSSPAMEHLLTIGTLIDYGDTIAVATFNGLLSLLTGGRIWWISREARRFEKPVHSKYKAIVVVILESGLLYPVSMIVATVIPIVLDPDSHGTVPIHAASISTLMAGLAPTLVIVRVAYGKSVESVQQMASIRFAERQAQHGGLGNTALHVTLDVRSHPQNETSELDDTKSTASKDMV
ncbi:hypothetical protein PM082_002308 [Marasmius tenuissimus]|nr:hypothetical protein PM082_002308 [Marasmius tenuissimus]